MGSIYQCDQGGPISKWLVNEHENPCFNNE